MAWRTATLQRARRVPSLAQLLRIRKRVPRTERADILAEVARLDAEFARLDAEAQRRREVQVDGR